LHAANDFEWHLSVGRASAQEVFLRDQRVGGVLSRVTNYTNTIGFCSTSHARVEACLVAHAPDYDVDSTLAEPERFAFLGQTIDSPFFTADVARLERGGVTVVEINDGGCSIFPEQLDPRAFYRAILGKPRRRG
jgi:ATP-grasp domain, R2K clade family 3